MCQCEHGGNIFRVFFIFDDGRSTSGRLQGKNVVMLFNGFQKKSQKMPEKEINKANDIMSVDAMMDERYGKVGSSEREAFRKEAYAY